MLEVSLQAYYPSPDTPPLIATLKQLCGGAVVEEHRPGQVPPVYASQEQAKLVLPLVLAPWSILDSYVEGENFPRLRPRARMTNPAPDEGENDVLVAHLHLECTPRRGQCHRRPA